MQAHRPQLSASPQILEQPAYVKSWSVATLPGFINAVLDRYQRNYGALPRQFGLVACPQAEINAIGGLPAPVRALSDSRTRIQHFTGCNRLYLVLLLPGADFIADAEAMQQHLAWSESYAVTLDDAGLQMKFIAASEEVETIGPVAA